MYFYFYFDTGALACKSDRNVFIRCRDSELKSYSSQALESCVFVLEPSKISAERQRSEIKGPDGRGDAIGRHNKYEGVRLAGCTRTLRAADEIYSPVLKFSCPVVHRPLYTSGDGHFSRCIEVALKLKAAILLLWAFLSWRCPAEKVSGAMDATVPR